MKLILEFRLDKRLDRFTKYTQGVLIAYSEKTDNDEKFIHATEAKRNRKPF